MKNLFKEVKTVGELKAILDNLSDDTVLFQTNPFGGNYRKKLSVLNINESNEHFKSWHKNIKILQSTEDKIKGTHKNLKNIVIFGS
jgi:hypothetical protein